MNRWDPSGERTNERERDRDRITSIISFLLMFPATLSSWEPHECRHIHRVLYSYVYISFMEFHPQGRLKYVRAHVPFGKSNRRAVVGRAHVPFGKSNRRAVVGPWENWKNERRVMT